MPVQQVLSSGGMARPAPVEVELDGSEGVGQPPEPQGRWQRQHGCGTGGEQGWHTGGPWFSPPRSPVCPLLARVSRGLSGRSKPSSCSGGRDGSGCAHAVPMSMGDWARPPHSGCPSCQCCCPWGPGGDQSPGGTPPAQPHFCFTHRGPVTQNARGAAQTGTRVTFPRASLIRWGHLFQPGERGQSRARRARGGTHGSPGPGRMGLSGIWPRPDPN